ncbi:restriction endonuclease subunit S [Thermoflavimicrobium daqui]|uniref:Restriction endonuclease n=1 Tax=Thermoflavimicrobium daqui TaxID=2137476 RepID=A0A364K152_9BACL|nr:restriction endonuclease subunit S [Thermoflavimicrobium daqui]RAL21422.1 restriction endonuclease [Thermoflavimicrobium daqui]
MLSRFIELLDQRNMVDREQIAIELLRVHITHRAYKQKIGTNQSVDEDVLYALMIENTEERLGYFPGDQSWFAQLYHSGKELDLTLAIQELFQKDRFGTIISPRYLVDYFTRQIAGHVETILIPEAHKHLHGLTDMIEVHLDKYFVLTAEKKWLVELLRFIFEAHPHVEVLQLSIYSLLDLEYEFDWILSIPAFGLKPDIDTGRFLTRESEGIAAQNLLDWLGEFGELQIIVPARFTFSGGTFASLRTWILQHFSVKSIFTLPEGTLRPYTGMKTYLITISAQPVEEIQLGSFERREEGFLPMVEKEISQETLADREDWRMEILLAHEQLDLLDQLTGANRSIVKLKEIADLFRGKSIMKSHIQPGEISVLNISNIEEGEIFWDHMDTIDEELRKVRRYELEVGDLVMTCRGTVNKVAVVRDLPKKVIASANIIVMRFQKKVISEYVKIFLESPVGLELIKTFQRGTTVMNINPKDLGEMEIPLPEIEVQERIVAEYRKEQQLYLEAVRKANERWENVRKRIYEQLLD